MSKETIGIIGQGFVGSAVYEGMKNHFDILAFDKDPNKFDDAVMYDTLTYKEILEKSKSEAISQYSKNLQYFLSSKISSDCLTIKKYKKDYLPENNQKILSICSNFSKIKLMLLTVGSLLA